MVNDLITSEQQRYISSHIEDVAFAAEGPVSSLSETASSLGLRDFHEARIRMEYDEISNYHLKSLSNRHPVKSANGNYAEIARGIASTLACSEIMKEMFAEKNKAAEDYGRFI